ncbi:type II secretion system F family protein [Inconstantimicrobium porci]|uniref:type II secretion system F family protein n=1 Tax=Inconstantimicrobium porci TaxID=2652291 RepID=UPI00240A383C|nr:type II secretion system F family protein [Inconstantimicrobium porci]MDD6771902.1 type II secretion system F family protein [Inconstantimicrobium porci]
MIDYNSIIFISKNLGVFIKSGIPISIALDEISEELSNKKYRKSIYSIKEDIAGGSTLYAAFTQHKDIYPDLFLIMIDLGEYTGRFDTILGKLSDYYLKLKKERGKCMSAALYPVIVAAAVFIFLIMYMLFLLPNLQQFYIGMDRKPSGIVALLFSISSFMRKNILSSIALFIAVLLSVFYFTTISFIKDKISKIKHSFSLYKIQRELFFIRLLYLLSISGIPINMGIQKFNSFDSSIVSNTEIAKFYTFLSRGNTLSESIRQCFDFSKITSSLIAMGENTGTLDEKLHTICISLEEKYYEKLFHITSLIQPVSLLFLGIIILVMFIMVYGSIYGGIQG